MIKPRIPGQTMPHRPVMPAGVAPVPTPINVVPAGSDPDLTAPLQARLAVISATLAPLLKEQARLTAAIKALTSE